ncbi:hypothetical protein PVAP13_3KG042670 [Panicum virgatum]|uniref:Uncharacterized protein n=1 Tax=Panicum virgatum TaxID=38727 RepID=A0A8T0UFE8_PANVG|nr:hypothetical protein PVAP13_3KG042670 [Panicum virgatum]
MCARSSAMSVRSSNAAAWGAPPVVRPSLKPHMRASRLRVGFKGRHHPPDRVKVGPSHLDRGQSTTMAYQGRRGRQSGQGRRASKAGGGAARHPRPGWRRVAAGASPTENGGGGQRWPPGTLCDGGIEQVRAQMSHGGEEEGAAVMNRR